MGANSLTDTINPYESPKAPVDFCAQVASDVAGPWRDGPWMVVHISTRTEFPNRCLITGQQLRGAQRERRRLPADWFAPRDIDVIDDWPIDRQQVDQQYTTERLGLMAAGLVYVPLGIGVCLPFIIYLLSGEVLYMACLSFSVIVAGLFGVMALIMPKPDLHVICVQNGFAWIRGVHTDVLEAMPPSPIER